MTTSLDDDSMGTEGTVDWPAFDAPDVGSEREEGPLASSGDVSSKLLVGVLRKASLSNSSQLQAPSSSVRFRLLIV